MQNICFNPEISLYTTYFCLFYRSADVLNVEHYGSVPVLAYNSGQVIWVPPMVTRTECPMDLTYYPFDKQMCSIYMGSWTTHGFQIDFIPFQPNATTVRKHEKVSFT